MQSLVTASEIAMALGVSRQRLDVICKTDPTFPAPVGIAGRTRLWDRATVDAWMANRTDRRRRPK